MALSRVKTWIAGEVLTASDLNAEFNSIITNAVSLISPVTGAFDFDGNTITLDAAGATQVVSSTAVSWNFTSGAKSGTPAATGSVQAFSAQTFTDSNTAGSGTATAHVFYGIAVPTLAATNASVTTTNAATWYIAGPPTAGTNETITNAWALWIDAGNIRLDGELRMGSAVSPQSSDGAALGSSSLMWSDLFLASGGVVNFNNGNLTLTHSDGVLALGGGATDLVLDLSNAAAGQIKFPATQNSSSDANTLDDYEEGTWTPVLSDGTNNATMGGGTAGTYRKIGSAVMSGCRVITTSLGSVTGGIRVTGFPFTSQNTIAHSMVGGNGSGLNITAGMSVTAQLQGNGTFATLFLWDATAGATAMQGTEWTDDGDVFFAGWYPAAA